MPLRPGVLAACLFARPGTVRTEIEATLADMSRAVLAADKDAFLSRVAKDEPTFATEWRHWAEQLPDAQPAEFSMTIGEGKATFEPTLAEFPLVMSWRITTGPKESWGAGGTKRTVTFPPVVFSKDGPAPSRWMFHGEHWERRKCDGFVICYLPGNERVVHEVFQAFPVARDHDNEG